MDLGKGGHNYMSPRNGRELQLALGIRKDCSSLGEIVDIKKPFGKIKGDVIYSTFGIWHKDNLIRSLPRSDFGPH